MFLLLDELKVSDRGSQKIRSAIPRIPGNKAAGNSGASNQYRFAKSCVFAATRRKSLNCMFIVLFDACGARIAHALPRLRTRGGQARGGGRSLRVELVLVAQNLDQKKQCNECGRVQKLTASA